MANLSLLHPFPSVSAPEGKIYFGGAQQTLSTKTLCDFGCGLIASANLLTYLGRFHGVRDGQFDRFRKEDCIPLAAFNESCMNICRGLLRPIPGIGLTGFALAFALNGMFRRRNIPYRASWCMRRKPLWDRVAEMLREDLPVIFAIGPNFPFFWRKKMLTFYRKNADGTYVPATKTCGHFVTITALDGDWARISSWGGEYYISRTEFDTYCKKHSAPLFSNLLLLQHK